LESPVSIRSQFLYSPYTPTPPIILAKKQTTNILSLACNKTWHRTKAEAETVEGEEDESSREEVKEI